MVQCGPLVSGQLNHCYTELEAKHVTVIRMKGRNWEPWSAVWTLVIITIHLHNMECRWTGQWRQQNSIYGERDSKV